MKPLVEDIFHNLPHFCCYPGGPCSAARQSIDQKWKKVMGGGKIGIWPHDMTDCRISTVLLKKPICRKGWSTRGFYVGQFLTLSYYYVAISMRLRKLRVCRDT
uniref:Uncharacterized protein MANES_16G075300 n=1 Tax=Rhizophora mucronata TaxID=61149 RepID=A0A2P2KFU7_RHIMU